MADARLRLRIDVDSANAERGMGRLQTSMGRLSSTLKTGLATAAKVAGGALATLATVGVAAGIKYNATMEQSAVAWETLLGSASKATDMLKRISDFAKATPFETMDVDIMAKYMHNAGFEGENLFKQLMKISDTASAFAIPIDQAKEMARQMSQVQQAGVAYTEDLNVLQDRGVPIYKAIAKEVGVNVAEVKKMASEGKITADIYNAAFDSIAKGVEGASDKQSKTFSGMISTLKDNLDILAGALSKPIFEALKAGLGAVMPMLEKFTELVTSKGVGAAFMSLFPPSVQDVLKTIGGAIKEVWDNMQGFFKAIGGAQAIMSGLGAAFNFIKGVIMGYIGYVKQLFSGDGNVGQAFVRIFNVIKGIAVPILQDAIAFIKGILDQLRQFWDENGAQIMQAVKNLWSGIAAIFEAIAPVLMFIVGFIWDSIKGVIQGALDIIMGLIKVFAGLFTGDFGKMWEGIKQLFMGALQFLWNLMNLMLVGNIIKAIKAFFTGGIALVKAGWTAIKEGWRKPLDWIWKFVDDVFDGIKQLFTLFKQHGQNTTQAMWSVIKSLWTSAVNGVKAVANGFKSALTAVWNGIKTGASTAWNAIKTTAITVWNAIKSGVMAVVNGWRNLLSGAWNGMKTAATTVWNGIKTAITAVVNFLKSDITTKFNTIKSVATTIFNGVKTAITNPIESAKKVVLGIIDAIKGAFSRMHITIPKPKLPKVSVAMKKGVMGIPYPDFNVSWNAKGGIWDGASVIGVGEAGPEAVVPLSGPRMNPFADAIANRIGGGGKGVENNFHIAQLVVREEADIKKIARELKSLQDRKNR